MDVKRGRNAPLFSFEYIPGSDWTVLKYNTSQITCIHSELVLPGDFMPMQEPEESTKILEEIRDIQREHLNQYKEVTKRSLELQQQAVTRQEQLGKVYMRVVLAGAGLIVFIVVLIFYLLTKLR